MRIIDADKLEADMYHNAFEVDTDLQRWDSGCWIRYKMFENVIEEQPTVDAVPVTHGHWINHYDDLFPEESTRECSVCHAEQMVTMLDDNYCPHCGAKMERREE